ncbi:hypothetical protein R2601_02753 [Salipiger bermudensis HTCC2601]|uniref:Uncharacterized protein n=1 Tax=Salipiger bermudensis (strain DSM 26914 / JCM 13377 / KCTC 12554 / HTCC2601) TaxID=314265 RepID=Q0FWU5_SALBH|nr:hypothetical protein R2601_02753 [Salipiger bermudensis HTCC2601]
MSGGTSPAIRSAPCSWASRRITSDWVGGSSSNRAQAASQSVCTVRRPSISDSIRFAAGLSR